MLKHHESGIFVMEHKPLWIHVIQHDSLPFSNRKQSTQFPRIRLASTSFSSLLCGSRPYGATFLLLMSTSPCVLYLFTTSNFFRSCFIFYLCLSSLVRHYSFQLLLIDSLAFHGYFFNTSLTFPQLSPLPSFTLAFQLHFTPLRYTFMLHFSLAFRSYREHIHFTFQSQFTRLQPTMNIPTHLDSVNNEHPDSLKLSQ
jgi:hypothetical protein